MPGYDRTGPMGVGPMTGGVRGRCNPATVGNIPAYADGYGYGRSLGLRRGFRGGSGSGMGRGGGLPLARNCFGHQSRWSRKGF